MLTLIHNAIYFRVLHNATNNTDLLSVLGKGAHNNIINAIERAAMAANQSREAADGALKVTKVLLVMYPVMVMLIKNINMILFLLIRM